jgi:hypothetical protein
MDADPWRQWRQAFAAFGAPSSLGASGVAGSFAPFMDAAERFAAATKSFRDATARAGAAAVSATAAQAAAETFGNFLRDQFADFIKMPWAGAAPLGAPVAGAAIGELPALGLTREHQERAQRATQALGKMADAQRRLQRLWSDTLREAASAYVAGLGNASATPLTPDAINRLYDVWIDCAEEAYARTAHSEPFCDALADYVNAESHWRRESNAAAELWAKLLDLPTRNELNTLAGRLRALEEQLQAQANTRPTSAGRERRAPKGKPQ